MTLRKHKRVNTRKRKRVNTQKRVGGQIVKYKDIEWHDNWEPLNVHSKDCAANCFCLLGYSDRDTCNDLALRTPNGVHHSKIIDILDGAYGAGHEWKHITRNNHINKYLRNHQATLAGIDSLVEPSGHYFVILKNKTGIHAIDAQTGMTWRIDNYINHMNFNKDTLYILYSPHISLSPSDYNKVTMEMVKDYFPNGTDEFERLKNLGYGDEFSDDELIEHLRNMGYEI
jgi:hypothetical protein